MTDLIVDRKNIKWTAMMLSEHRSMLHHLEQEQHYVDPPHHDEDRLGELAEQLARAMQNEKLVTMTFWKDKRHHIVFGIVKRIDPLKKAVLMEMNEDDRRWIPAEHIVDIEF